MTPPGESAPQAHATAGGTFTTIGVVLLSLVGFGAFFVAFLLAPLVVIVVCGLVFAAHRMS